MTDQEKKSAREKLKREEYEKGFAAKCAERGIDPDDLLKGLWTGECEESTVKKADAATGMTKQAWVEYLFGGGDQNVGDDSAWGAIGDSVPGVMARNVGRGLYNVGEESGLNNIGRWIGGERFGNVQKTYKPKSYVSWGGGEDPGRAPGGLSQNDYAGQMGYQGQISPEVFARYSDADKTEFITSGKNVPTAAAMNAYYAKRDAKEMGDLRNARPPGWMNLVDYIKPSGKIVTETPAPPTAPAPPTLPNPPATGVNAVQQLGDTLTNIARQQQSRLGGF